MMYMAFSRLVGMMAGLVSSAVLGRLLLPSDYGLVAMAATVMVMINLIKDFGLSTAIIQKQELTISDLDSTFWINLLISLVLALIGFVAAPHVAQFYDNSDVEGVLKALCAGMVLSSAGAVHGALLRRNLKFLPLMWSEVAGQVVALIVGVALAWKYGSYWSLVCATILGSVVTAALTIAAEPWIPRFKINLSIAKQLLRFGTNLSFYSFLNFFATQFGAIAIGTLLGATQAGYFNRAQQLLIISGNALIQPVSQICLPMLSRLANDPVRYRSYYITLLERTAVVFGSIGAFVALAGGSLSSVLLGPTWEVTGTMFRWYGLAIVAVGMSSQTGNVLLSQTRVNELRNWGLQDAIIRVGASSIGLYWGAEGLAAGFSIATLFVTVPAVIAIIGRKGPITIKDQIFAILPGALIATITISIGTILSLVYVPTSKFLSIGSGATAVACAVVATLVLSRRARKIFVSIRTQGTKLG